MQHAATHTEELLAAQQGGPSAAATAPSAAATALAQWGSDVKALALLVHQSHTDFERDPELLEVRVDTCVYMFGMGGWLVRIHTHIQCKTPGLVIVKQGRSLLTARH
jgi:hypothetical protein